MNQLSPRMSLVLALFKKAQEKYEIAKQQSREALDRANEEEDAMKSRYSTFKEEGQYLHRGLKQRANTLLENINTLQSLLSSGFKMHDCKKISNGSIVTVEFEDSGTAKYFIISVFGGERINNDICTLSLTSPMARAILGKKEGDEFKVLLSKKVREGVILDVQ